MTRMDLTNEFRGVRMSVERILDGSHPNRYIFSMVYFRFGHLPDFPSSESTRVNPWPPPGPNEPNSGGVAVQVLSFQHANNQLFLEYMRLPCGALAVPPSPDGVSLGPEPF